MVVRIITVAPYLWQPVTGEVQVCPQPIPAGWRIRSICLRYDAGATPGDSCYGYLGVSRGDGSDYARLDDMAHVNDVIGEKVLCTNPIDIVSDGKLFPAMYILQAVTTSAYPIRWIVVCDDGGV